MGMYNKHLTLVPIGGLANRFYAVTSALSFCLDNQIALKVIWFKDKGMGAGFHDLFNLDPSLRQDVAVVDAKWSDYIFDRPRKRNFWLPYIPQKLLFQSCIYEKDILEGFSSNDLLSVFDEKSKVYLVHYCRFYEIVNVIGFIRPNEYIARKIDERIQSFNNKKVIGIHIRRGDHTIPTLKSPLSLFVEKMNVELESNENVCFYVASDSIEEKNKLIEIFGDKVITMEGDLRRDTESGIVDALVELFTLSGTSKIYGSLASTYSFLAAELSSIPLEILSIDNEDGK